MRRIFLLITPLLCLAPALAIGDSPSPSVGAWNSYLHKQLYGDREIGEVDENYMRLDGPANTPDPASTPLSLHLGKAAAGKIKQVRIIIDNNPSPLAATMDLKPGVPIDEIDLRVRVDRFTSVRAIAEDTDGRLEMRSTWINAAGGCSAPPSAAGGGQLGDIRFRPSDDNKSLLVSLRHPNSSGFQINPVSGDPIPPHYVRHIKLSAGGQTILEADTGISIAENPSVRISSATALAGPIRFEAEDLPTLKNYSATWNGSAAKAAGTSK
ncbi:MAG: quinoprotein dehydrogenase-associated SoxYZ-like carrier [Rhodanobacter sp.]|jgi:sulfur-oxidizing protein SoxY|nr:quinoprotein dehydrogenase-associated SoxYZ-like carrier [Rhodanobacter sp.]